MKRFSLVLVVVLAVIFSLGCVAYAGKPIDQDKFENVLRKLNLID